MRKSKRKVQKTDVWSAKKKLEQSEKKFTALFKILLKNLN